jgi:hypothetical protein
MTLETLAAAQNAATSASDRLARIRRSARETQARREALAKMPALRATLAFG